MNVKFNFAAILAVFFIGGLVCFSSCDDKNISVTGVSLNKQTLSLVAGETEQLSVTVLPAGATNKDVIWISSDTTVVTVNNGLVTSVLAGTATIQVITKDGVFKDECEVAVSAQAGTAVVRFGSDYWLSDIIAVTLSSKSGNIFFEFAKTNLDTYPFVLFSTPNTTGTTTFIDKENNDAHYCEYYAETSIIEGKNTYGDWLALAGDINITEYADDKISGTINMTMFSAKEADEGKEHPEERKMTVYFSKLDVQ